jgi:hypothetical protein
VPTRISSRYLVFLHLNSAIIFLSLSFLKQQHASTEIMAQSSKVVAQRKGKNVNDVVPPPPRSSVGSLLYLLEVELPSPEIELQQQESSTKNQN